MRKESWNTTLFLLLVIFSVSIGVGLGWYAPPSCDLSDAKYNFYFFREMEEGVRDVLQVPSHIVYKTVPSPFFDMHSGERVPDIIIEDYRQYEKEIVIGKKGVRVAYDADTAMLTCRFDGVVVDAVSQVRTPFTKDVVLTKKALKQLREGGCCYTQGDKR